MKIQKIAIMVLLTTTLFIISACGGGGGGGTTNLPPSISTQPTDQTMVAGNNTSFSVTASGTGLTYQWQVDTTNSGTFTNITDTGVYSGSTSATLTLTGVTLAMNGYKYRVVVSGTVAPAATSNGSATLTVTQAATAIVKLATSGTLAPGVFIGGISTTVIYPTNKGLSIANSDVVSSGGALGTTPTASTVTPGQVGFANLFNEIPSGIPAGEFATLTFGIAAPNSPVASDFTIDTNVTTVIDNNANPLVLPVVIQSVTFQ